MTKVMISLPDDVLERLDREAELRGLTRSGLIAQFADDATMERRRIRAARMAEIDAMGSINHGGNSAERVKQSRPKL